MSIILTYSNDDGERIDITESAQGRNMLEGMPWLGDSEVQALREFFATEEHPDLTEARARWQSQEDARLGRWRWPESTDYVVYPSGRWTHPADVDLVMVVNESNGMSHRARREDTERLFGFFSEAARAYFDAHPDRKPWHDAKGGEVWVVTIEGKELAAQVDDDLDLNVELDDGYRYVHVTDAAITSGRRIWPEATS